MNSTVRNFPGTNGVEPSPLKLLSDKLVEKIRTQVGDDVDCAMSAARDQVIEIYRLALQPTCGPFIAIVATEHLAEAEKKISALAKLAGEQHRVAELVKRLTNEG